MRAALQSLNCLVLCLLLCRAASVGAQYVYLDCDGDGVHSSADVLSPVKATTVTVYLNTQHDRDGKVQFCNSHTKSVGGGAPIEIFSYDLILRVAEGTGTVDWGTYSDATGFEPLGKDDFNDTDFHTSYGMPVGTLDEKTATLASGGRKLGTIGITPKSGAPVIVISTTSSLDPTYYTGFGTMCKA